MPTEGTGTCGRKEVKNPYYFRRNQMAQVTYRGVNMTPTETKQSRLTRSI